MLLSGGVFLLWGHIPVSFPGEGALSQLQRLRAKSLKRLLALLPGLADLHDQRALFLLEFGD